MLNYVDGFSCSLKQDSRSLVIHFTQNEPKVNVDGNVELTTLPVTSVIMEKASAKALLSLLTNLYGDELSDDEGVSE